MHNTSQHDSNDQLYVYYMNTSTRVAYGIQPHKMNTTGTLI